MKLIVALLVFGIIVIFHEFGHFIVAKKNGIVVEEFAVGMGPKLFGVRRGETEYTLRLLPLGGACMMLYHGFCLCCDHYRYEWLYIR